MRSCFSTRAVPWLLFALLSLAFFDTVRLRRPAFDQSLDCLHDWLTASTTIAVRNWHRDGFFSDHGLKLFNPASVEFSSLSERGVYRSTAAGNFFLPFLLGKLLGREATPALVQTAGLINHGVGAGALFLIGLFVTRKRPLPVIVTVSLLTPVLWLNLGGPLWWMQNACHSEMMVVPSFLLMVLLELAYWRVRGSPTRWAQGVRWAVPFVMFWGAYTEWLFVALVPAIALLRIPLLVDPRPEERRAEKRRLVFHVVLPMVGAIALHLFQLTTVDGWKALVFLFGRYQDSAYGPSGLSASDFFRRIWKGPVVGNYGLFLPWMGIVSFVLSTVLYGVAERRRSIGEGRWNMAEFFDRAPEAHALALLLLPALFLLGLLPLHNLRYDFSGVKYGAPLVFVLAAVLPIQGGRIFPSAKWIPLLFWALLALLPSQRYIWGNLSRSHYRRVDREAAEAIGRHTTFNEVVFSPDLIIGRAPPQMLSFSMKRVYNDARRPALMKKVRARAPQARAVQVFYRGSPNSCSEPPGFIGGNLMKCAVADDAPTIAVPMEAMERYLEWDPYDAL